MWPANSRIRKENRRKPIPGRLDRFTRNIEHPEHGPCLQFPETLIKLDKPRRDFTIAKPKGEGYFHMRWSCDREYGSVAPPPEVGNRCDYWVMDKQTWGGGHVWGHPQPPLSSPWILNTACFRSEANTGLKIRWGPNYYNPSLGAYVDVEVGGITIWNSDPYMTKQLKNREKNEEQFIMENQTVQLRTIVEINPESPHQRKTKEDPPVWKGGGKYGYQEISVELQDCYGDPLWAMFTQTRPTGHQLMKGMKDLIAMGEGLERTWLPVEGPLPRQEFDTICQWIWVWRGLDQRITLHPSPLYQELLKGRVTTTEDGVTTRAPPKPTTQPERKNPNNP